MRKELQTKITAAILSISMLLTTFSVPMLQPFYSPKIILSSSRTGVGGTISVHVTWDNGFVNVPIPAKNLK